MRTNAERGAILISTQCLFLMCIALCSHFNAHIKRLICADDCAALAGAGSRSLRTKHYSLRTEETCESRIKRFILFHGKRHLREMSAPEVEAFLSDFAVPLSVAAS